MSTFSEEEKVPLPSPLLSPPSYYCYVAWLQQSPPVQLKGRAKASAGRHDIVATLNIAPLVLDAHNSSLNHDISEEMAV